MPANPWLLNFVKNSAINSVSVKQNNVLTLVCYCNEQLGTCGDIRDIRDSGDNRDRGDTRNCGDIKDSGDNRDIRDSGDNRDLRDNGDKGRH